MKLDKLEPQFVEFIPRELKDGILYISMTYATASHHCCCGCGTKIVTPLTKTDWRLIFDGTVSLAPSIGNWSIPCQSHYWIKNDKVQMAGPMSQHQIDAGREHDRVAKQKHYGPLPRTKHSDHEKARLIEPVSNPERGFWRGVIAWLNSLFKE